MAGLYIRWVKGLSRRREVLVMGRKLNLSRREVACACMEVWEWADDETSDGTILGARAEDVDRLIGVPGFASAMMAPDVGWLVESALGITFPRWSKNNGESAKKREYERDKKREQRKLRPKKRVPKLSRKSPGKNGDKKGTPLYSLSSLPLPLILKKKEFETALETWLAYKHAKREDYVEQGLKAMISLAERRATEFGLQAVINAMEMAMAGGWKGWDQDSSFQAQPKNGSRQRVFNPADPRGNLATAAEYAAEITGGNNEPR